MGKWLNFRKILQLTYGGIGAVWFSVLSKIVKFEYVFINHEKFCCEKN